MDKHLRGLQSYIQGHAAEEKVAAFLKKKGYKLVEKNWHAGWGSGACELDLIMQDEKTLVFIEVKKRTVDEAAFYAITENMQKRIYKAAECFLKEYPHYGKCDCRFDAVFVLSDEIVHMPNAFQG